MFLTRWRVAVSSASCPSSLPSSWGERISLSHWQPQVKSVANSPDLIRRSCLKTAWERLHYLTVTSIVFSIAIHGLKQQRRESSLSSDSSSLPLTGQRVKENWSRSSNLISHRVFEYRYASSLLPLTICLVITLCTTPSYPPMLPKHNPRWNKVLNTDLPLTE